MRGGLLACFLAAGGAALGADTKGPALVDAQAEVPGLRVELKYSGPDNFLKQRVYPQGARCLLLRETAAALARAAKALSARGLYLKAYDCYRPLSVQRKMWELFPRRGYVANPKGGSAHNRGTAVDVTLVDAAGRELEMPTPFDTFTPESHHEYAGGTAASRKNRAVLRRAMERAGFRANRMEWWHYELPGTHNRPLLDLPVDSL